jgi:hypothetical protein
VQRTWDQFEPQKMCFHVFSRMIIGFIIFKERKLPDPTKIETIVNMLILTNPQQTLLKTLSIPTHVFVTYVQGCQN